MGVESFNKVREDIIKQNQEIELFRNDDIYLIAQMVLCEAHELVEATETGFVTDDLTAVASEAADCLYVLFRLFDLLGIDERAVEMKIERNYQKYFGKESREQAIADWKEGGGDQAFFEEYLDKDTD